MQQPNLIVGRWNKNRRWPGHPARVPIDLFIFTHTITKPAVYYFIYAHRDGDRRTLVILISVGQPTRFREPLAPHTHIYTASSLLGDQKYLNNNTMHYIHYLSYIHIVLSRWGRGCFYGEGLIHHFARQPVFFIYLFFTRFQFMFFIYIALIINGKQ